MQIISNNISIKLNNELTNIYTATNKMVFRFMSFQNIDTSNSVDIDVFKVDSSGNEFLIRSVTLSGRRFQGDQDQFSAGQLQLNPNESIKAVASLPNIVDVVASMWENID